MPDGHRRKRRNRKDKRAEWYAVYRSARFAARFGGITVDIRRVCVILKGEGRKS